MTFIRSLAGASLSTAFVITMIGNLMFVCRWRLHRQRASLILLAGGIAGLVGFLILPVPALNRWFWLPILADFAVPYGVGFLLSKVRR